MYKEIITNIINKVTEKFGKIIPCPSKTWDECVTIQLNKIMVWFYIDDGSKSSGVGYYDLATHEYII